MPNPFATEKLKKMTNTNNIEKAYFFDFLAKCFKAVNSTDTVTLKISRQTIDILYFI